MCGCRLFCKRLFTFTVEELFFRLCLLGTKLSVVLLGMTEVWNLNLLMRMMRMRMMMMWFVMLTIVILHDTVMWCEEEVVGVGTVIGVSSEGVVVVVGVSETMHVYLQSRSFPCGV